MNTARPHLVFSPNADARWLLEYDGFDPLLEPSIEAVFALVNGYGGTRAALEEGSPVSRPSAFVAGVFNTPARPQAPELEAPISELVVAPDWSRVRIMVEGADLRIGAPGCELLGQRRVLDMRAGVLLRSWRVQDAAGRITQLTSLRFASLDNRHALVQVLTILPENYDGTVALECMVDGRVMNENHTPHLAPVAARTIPAGQLLAMRTMQSGYQLAYAAHATLLDARGASLAGTPILAEEQIGMRWEWQASAGQPVQMQKIVACVTSRDTAQPMLAAPMLLETLISAGAAGLLAAHTRAWAARWERADIQIGGDDETQRQVRFALYHLIGAAHADEHASVGARALTGERYRGHVFWDTETFVWPFYLFTAPETARALLMYRFHTLAGARAKARELGYKGALFAWESTDTGEETTPPFITVPGLGRQQILTGLQEHHLAADIAYAIVQYRQATGDDAFFFGYGAEMLLEIARFWASRAHAGPDGRFHIATVIGPDEYHDSVDDNAYTNIMAGWALRAGAAAAAELALADPALWAALVARIALEADETAEWRSIADALVTGFDPGSGIFEQFAGYFQLGEIDLRDHDTAAMTLDVKLGWEALQRLQALKQADVVMLLFLLWDDFEPDVRAANFRFYEPRTTHDSSLSPSIHALVAARLGDLPLADSYLRRAVRIDLDFARKGWAGASGGVHIAALGGIWQALAFGFAGFYPDEEGLRFRPQVPARWGELRLPLQWRGRLLRIVARAHGPVEITLEQGAPLQVAIHDGAWRTLAAGETIGG
jgi:kojibiose phosphorylase